MDTRDATAADASAVGRVARESLVGSYSHFVDESTIDAMVEEWYDPDRVADLLADEGAVLEVAEADGEVVGFVQGAVVETDPVVGEIHWLHVVPGERGEGVGVQLLGRVQETFRKRGAAVLRGLVLEDNEDGTAFYADQGFERVDERETEIEGETYVEAVYELHLDDAPAEQVVERVTGPDGRDLYVNFSEAQRGLRAAFYPVFGTPELTDRYGWYCGACESLDNAMDPMGRIVCNDCGNKRKATRWDASYL